jgi:hypothetical protein
MLQQKLIVGRYFDFTVPDSPRPTGDPGSFQPVDGQQCYLQESTGVFTKTSAVVDGPGEKEHRNFIWLPWVPGRITEVPLGKADVLTGPMSGCWLVTYSNSSGKQCVGHIGTKDNAQDPDTIAVKETWNSFAKANPGSVKGGFNPVRGLSPSSSIPAAKIRGAESIFIYGLVTTENNFYTMVTYRQTSITTAQRYRIYGLQTISSSNDLKNI